MQRRVKVTNHSNGAPVSHCLERQHGKECNVHEDEATDSDTHGGVDHSRQVTPWISHVSGNETYLQQHGHRY